MQDKVNFVKLNKYAKLDMTDLKLYKLALLGNCSTQHIAKALKGYGYLEGFNLDIFDADYNQIESQIIDEASKLYNMNPDSVLIYMASEKLLEEYCKIEVNKRSEFANIIIEKIKFYWEKINSKLNANIIQFNFVEIDDKVFGNYSNKVTSSFLFQLRKLNYMLDELASNTKNAFIIDLSSIQNEVGRQNFYDDKLYYIAKMPISLNVLPDVAKQVVTLIKTLNGKFKKCVILDLDNTLWGGVIGDDGINSIQIGELGLGRAFSEFQMWLKELKNRGIILAVCSKNNEDIAKEPFIKHPDMVLRLDDISMFVANWQDKATNIKNIQQTLNIGMDSIVFIDDNPFERNLVRQLVQDINVPELPEDPALYLSYLRSLNLFETTSYSENDKDRTKQYQAEVGRTKLQSSFKDFDEYLDGLDMKAEYHEFDEFDIPRISQLTQRSNQFNLRTIRYTEEDITKIKNNKDKYITLSYSLKDKFGSYGLISVLIMEIKDKENLFIDTWLMSCRVLKRGMEEFIINKAVEIAKEKGFKKIIGEYIPTKKNKMVENIYKDLGFSKISDTIFEVNINKFKNNKTKVK